MSWLDRELAPGDVGDLSVLEAASAAPMSDLPRRPGESLASWDARLKAGDAQLAKKPAKKPAAKTRSGGSAAAAFEQAHPRGRGGQWIFKQGASGPAVKAIQSHVGAKTDGSYGTLTKGAVERFQRQHGLKVDGLVGAQTVAAMMGKRRAAQVKAAPMSAADRAWLLKQAKRTG